LSGELFVRLVTSFTGLICLNLTFASDRLKRPDDDKEVEWRNQLRQLHLEHLRRATPVFWLTTKKRLKVYFKLFGLTKVNALWLYEMHDGIFNFKIVIYFTNFV